MKLKTLHKSITQSSNLGVVYFYNFSKIKNLPYLQISYSNSKNLNYLVAGKQWHYYDFTHKRSVNCKIRTRFSTKNLKNAFKFFEKYP